MLRVWRAKGGVLNLFYKSNVLKESNFKLLRQTVDLITTSLLSILHVHCFHENLSDKILEKLIYRFHENFDGKIQEGLSEENA